MMQKLQTPQPQTDNTRKLGSSMLRLLQSHELRAVHGGAPSDSIAPPSNSNRSRKR